MIYRVRARFRVETAKELLRKLTDGTVARQVPDGPEIVAAMKRAVLNGAGEVEWSETCFCATPLAHERSTVLDIHFEDITTEVIPSHQRYQGKPFMEHLTALGV